jgi:hypothetical protein
MSLHLHLHLDLSRLWGTSLHHRRPLLDSLLMEQRA